MNKEKHPHKVKTGDESVKRAKHKQTKRTKPTQGDETQITSEKRRGSTHKKRPLVSKTKDDAKSESSKTASVKEASVKHKERRKSVVKHQRTEVQHKTPEKMKTTDASKQHGNKVKHHSRRKQSIGGQSTKTASSKRESEGRRHSISSKSKSVTRSHHKKTKKQGSNAVDGVRQKEIPNSVMTETETSLSLNRQSIIGDNVNLCYNCNSSGHYFNGCFFCQNCLERFDNIVLNKINLKCPNNGKCFSNSKCDFCLAEFMYLSGLTATDVKGFKFDSKKPVTVSDKLEALLPFRNEDETILKYFNRSTRTILNWLWQQGDILKLIPTDRTKLLQANIGRSRMMWLVADIIPRHDVIKLDDEYITPKNTSYENIAQILINLKDIAKYFRSLSFTQQHMHFLKLLSIFQIGTSQECSLPTIAHSKCRRYEYFKRSDEIKLIADTYCKVMRDMQVTEEDLKRISEIIDLMTCMNSILSEVEGIENSEYCFTLWTTDNPEWESREKDMIPPISKNYSEERLDLCFFLNRMTILALNCAVRCLSHHMSLRDMKVLLCEERTTAVIVYISWNAESFYNYREDKKGDEIVKAFYMQLKTIQMPLQEDLAPYLEFSDFLLVCLTRRFASRGRNLQDINIKSLYVDSKNASNHSLENKVKKLIPEKEREQKIMKEAKLSLERTLEKVDYTVAQLQSTIKTLPLLINTNFFIMDSY